MSFRLFWQHSFILSKKEIKFYKKCFQRKNKNIFQQFVWQKVFVNAKRVFHCLTCNILGDGDLNEKSRIFGMDTGGGWLDGGIPHGKFSKIYWNIYKCKM